MIMSKQYNFIFLVIPLLVIVLFSSCGNNKEKKVAIFENAIDYSDDVEEEAGYYESESSDIEDESEVRISYIEKNGVKMIPVVLNGIINADMILDTGCSKAMISLSEARYLASKGTLTEEDILGIGSTQIADGSIVENAIVRLRKVELGGKLVAYNVEATVSDNLQAPLLLGNEIFDRVKSVSINNETEEVVFNLY